MNLENGDLAIESVDDNDEWLNKQPSAVGFNHILASLWLVRPHFKNLPKSAKPDVMESVVRSRKEASDEVAAAIYFTTVPSPATKSIISLLSAPPPALVCSLNISGGGCFSNMFEHKGKWWHQTEGEACGACEEPFWETPIRDPQRFPPVFPSFRRRLRGNVKHIWAASFVAGYGLTATKTHTCGPGWFETLPKLLLEQEWFKTNLIEMISSFQ